MKKRILFLIFIAITIIFTFPMQIKPDPIKKEKSYTSNYCGCKSKPDYYVEVSLREIYVTVKDRDGKHIKDLRSGDFKLWEDDIEQKIVAVDKVDLKSAETISEGKTDADVVDTTPKRYFTMLIGNLPELKVEREKSKSAIRHFINNDIQQTDHLSLYIMNLSSLELIVPFNVNSQQSKDAILKYLDTEDFGGKGFQSTRRGRLSWSDEERHIKNMEFLQVAKLLDSLCNSLQYINGKKDVVIFSEGFYFDPDLEKDMAIQTNSASPDVFVTFVESKLSPSYASMGRKLIELKNVFIKYDISLQVIDLGKSSNLITASSNQAGAYFNNDAAGKNSPIAAERVRTEVLQTISSSSGGSYYSFSDTNDKIVKNLDKVDYDTSFYYVISYSSSEENDPDTFLPIKIKVSRDDATLGYKKGIVVHENFENLKENEQNAQMSFISQSSINYNMISICSSVAALPSEDNNSDLVFGAQIPLDEITKSDKYVNEVDLDIFIAAFNFNNDAVFNLQRQVKTDIKKEARKERKKSLGLYCSTPIAAGDYRVRFFIRNRHNMLISSEEYKITVPDFRNSSLIISSPLLYKDIQDVLSVNLDKAGVDDKNDERKTVLSSLPGVYTISNEVKNNRKIKIGVAIKGLKEEEILAHGKGFISWQAVKPIPAGFAEEPPVDLEYKVSDIIEKTDKTFLTLFELDISDLPKGDFETVIRTAKDGLTASSSMKIHII